MKHKLDLVFDCNLMPMAHTDYLVELTQAKMKVGLGADRYDLYDLCLDIKSPWSIRKFIQSALPLLEKTNPRHAQSA